MICIFIRCIYAHTATSAEESNKEISSSYIQIYCQSRALLQCKRVEYRKHRIRNRCHRLSSFYCLVLFCSLSSTVLKKLGLSSKFGNIQVANPARQPTNPGNRTPAQVPQTVKCVSLMEKKWLLIFLLILMIAASTFDKECIMRHNLPNRIIIYRRRLQNTWWKNEWILDDGIELKRWNAGLPEIKLNKYIARGVKNIVPRSITLMTTVPPQTSPECNCYLGSQHMLRHQTFFKGASDLGYRWIWIFSCSFRNMIQIYQLILSLIIWIIWKKIKTIMRKYYYFYHIVIHFLPI